MRTAQGRGLLLAETVVAGHRIAVEAGDERSVPADVIDDAVKKEADARAQRLALGFVRSPEYEKQAKRLIGKAIDEILGKVIEDLAPDLELAVREHVRSHFDEAVAEVARERLERAIEDVARAVGAR